MAKAKEKKEETFDIGGTKVSVSDVLSVQKIPQTNEDTIHTTKGTFTSSQVPQEFMDAIAESDEEG